MKKSTLKLGTRKSLLAWAQSSWVAREVERLNPGIRVELQGIETRGDRILDVPLTSVQGKEFFVAEIDHALLAEEVDFTVHSMKDLSLDRPPDLVCGAIPARRNPRDVILFSPRILERLRSGQSIRIGTSSPRRLENIPNFLEKALPQLNTAEGSNGKPKLEFVEIRGNVNTRLSRVHEPEDSPKALEAVVLAFAGIIRLWDDTTGQAELQKILEGVRWMVLPLRECPAAPAQGALAIECRASDSDVQAALRKLHHAETAESVKTERQLLSDWGGGCHQRFGATAVRTPELGNMLFIRGAKSGAGASVHVDELRWNVPEYYRNISQSAVAWDGSRLRSKEKSSTQITLAATLIGKALFVAHSRALQGDLTPAVREGRVWTSGTASWFRLAQAGVWVEGCAEGLGFELLKPLLAEPVLRLPELRQWMVLTHDQATEEWGHQGIQVIPTYHVNVNYDEAVKERLKTATHVFWSSGSQFDELSPYISSSKVEHACGPGKTAAHLRAAGLKPTLFPSAEEWRVCLKITN